MHKSTRLPGDPISNLILYLKIKYENVASLTANWKRHNDESTFQSRFDMHSFGNKFQFAWISISQIYFKQAHFYWQRKFFVPL